MTTTTLRSSRIASIHYDRGVGIPSSVRSSAASSPDPEDHPPQHPYHHPPHSQPLLPPIRVTSFPSFHHPSEDDWLKNGGRGVGGLASRIGRARFVVLMIMVLPLSLGAWVVSNHRLYDVSFIFAQDGRVRVKRRTLFRRDSLQKQQQQQHEQEQLDQDLLPSQQQQQQPILFFTTPVQTVPQQKQQTTLNPVVAKVKTVTGKRGATLRKKNKLTNASPVTKKAPPVATQRRTTTTTSTTKGQPKTPERTTSTNNKVQGFFQTMRLQHQARVHAPRSSTVTPTPPQPPPASSSSSSSDPAAGFFRRIRLRRRSAKEKRQGTATNTAAAVASAPVHVVVASTPGRGGMWGLWSAMARRDRSSSTTKEDEEDAPARLPVVEIRLATKYHSSRTKDRLGLTLRQPAIRTQRAEQAQLRRQQDDEVRRMALQLEQERLREAKIVQKQSFRDVVKQEVAKRMEARRDAAAVRIMMQTAAKDAAAQAKQEARTNAKREAQAKVHVKVDATPSRSSRSVTKATTQKVIVQNNCAQILDAAKDTESTGFWRRIRLRQRRGIEKTCLMSTQKKSQVPPKPKEISVETTKNWWGPIRFRRRPPSTKEPVAPADQTATTAKSVATSRKVDAPRKENAVVKPEPPRNVLHAVEAETKKRKDALPPKAQAPKKDTPSTNVGPTKSSGGIVIKRRERKSRPVERHSFLGGVTSVFWSKTKRSDSEVVTPLVEKNAPENVLPELLKYFTGAPATDEQPMGRSQARSSTRTTVVARHEPVVAPEPKYATFRIRSKPPRPKRPPAIRIRRVRREQES